jgi:mycothiol synthase
VLGFCWVKVHEDPWGRAGEIYVIGVGPDATGRGLGRVLLRRGLDAMAAAGLTEAFLYVENDNTPALGLYAAEGFEVAWFDALFEVVAD